MRADIRWNARLHDYEGSVCYFLNGKPARTSDVFGLRNLAPPRSKYMGIDCSGMCPPRTFLQLKFKETGNACAIIGYTCVKTSCDLASCYWYRILGDGHGFAFQQMRDHWIHLVTHLALDILVNVILDSEQSHASHV